jgi:VIT1/CCC1 family predicted Fe2+/Mn2+ transporter
LKEPRNREILRHISRDELRHYEFWKKYSHRDMEPDRLKLWKYLLIARVLGLTFGVRLMERDEGRAQEVYEKFAGSFQGGRSIVEDESEHEESLIGLIDEDYLRYVGSVVLGLNDALVELTGTLAGLTLALRNAGLIALVGSITGTAASLSMAASEYLSIKAEGGDRSPFKASVYTGIAYVLTVLLLISPFLIFTNIYLCLGVSILSGILVILLFTFYVSVTRNIPFRRRFLEMSLISLGVAGLSFAIGFLIRLFLNVGSE